MAAERSKRPQGHAPRRASDDRGSTCTSRPGQARRGHVQVWAGIGAPKANVKTLRVRTIAQWRDWLARHHASESEVWLIFHKNHAGVASIDYKDVFDATAAEYLAWLIARGRILAAA